MGYSAWYEHSTRHEVLNLIHYETLLQNATVSITKCGSYIITKYNRSLLQNAPGFLFQKVTVKCKNY